MLFGNFRCARAPLRRNMHLMIQFFSYHRSSHVPEMSLSYLPSMSIYYPSGRCTYKLLLHSFLEYYYTIVFVHDISCASKGFLMHGRNFQKHFSALNLTLICIQLFTCNNTTFSGSILNEIFLH